MLFTSTATATTNDLQTFVITTAVAATYYC